MNLCPIAQAAKECPHLIAIQTQDQAITYQELEKMVEKTCQEIEEKKGPIVWQSKNELFEIPLLLACFRTGKTACPLSFRLPENTFEEIKSSITYTPDEPYLLVATSGSSGKRKLTAITPFALIKSALGAIDPLCLGPQDLYHLSLPLSHVSGIGILYRTFLARATLLLASSPEAATHISWVPTQAYRMLKANLLPSPSWKTILLGGASISNQTLSELERRNFPIFCSYGLTESASIMTLNGGLLPYRKLKLTPEGEIQVGGEVLFSGYYPHLAKPDWHSTKDLGQIGPDGKLKVLGRKDFMMISGGENIFPEEIEKALLELENIVDALVIPTFSEEYGQRPIAFIETLSPFEEAHIKGKLAQKMEKFKVPDQIFPFPSHSTPGIKKSRHELKTHLQELLNKKNR